MSNSMVVKEKEMKWELMERGLKKGFKKKNRLSNPFIISQICIGEVWHDSTGFSAWSLLRLKSRCQLGWFL